MKIEVWSDFVCPFCYIGKRRLEDALKDFPQVDVVYKSFELDPGAERNTGQSIHEKLAAKYGRSLEETKQMTEGMSQQAAMEGLDFRFDSFVPTNTLDAHRVAKFAETKGIGVPVAERFFKAAFSEGRDLGDHSTLLELATESGLEADEVQNVLESDLFEDKVRLEEKQAQEIGVQGVPFFVINQKYAISGAQPKEVFVQGLEKAFAEEKERPTFEDLSKETGAACTDDSC